MQVSSDTLNTTPLAKIERGEPAAITCDAIVEDLGYALEDDPQVWETLLNYRDCAAILNVKVPTLKKMLKRGDGPPYLRIGRLVRFSPSMLRTWIRSQVEITAPSIKITEPETINNS
jgi:predicted DNA-binding transcriptional regulator AlpA